MKNEETGPEQCSHTPEPWRYQEESDAYTHIIRGPDNYYVAGFSQMASGRPEADARRSVACVNAMAGVADPAAELATLRLKAEAAEKLGKSLESTLSKYVSLVNSGDAGNWNPEIEPDVINARAALTAWQEASK